MNSHFHIPGKKVLILGNWSYRNMGDELILLGTIRLLQEQGKEIFVSAYDPEWLQSFFAQFPEMEGVHFLHEFPKGFRSAFSYLLKGRRKELKPYREVDAVIIGGGEILTEESVNAYRYWNFGLLPLLGKLAKIPVFLMGGIQVPKKQKNLILFRWLLRRTKAIFARDEESVQALQDFGFKKAEFFMDTSFFAYPWSKVEKTQQTKTVLINLNKNGEQFFEDLVRECELLLATGFELFYVPVSKGASATYDDLRYKAQLESRLGMTMQVLDWESNFEAFVQALKNAELVITARLHLFLLASFLGTKVKVFPYQKKILKMQKVVQNLKI